jgi:solute carrier family 39 (zinc transporter), member 1/2/3
MTELLELKLAAIVVIFAIAVAGGMLPRRVGRLENSDVVFSISNAFAGGLFLAVGLVHMVGDSGEHFREAGVEIQPNPELLLAVAGFLGVLLLEMVAGGRLKANLAESMGPGQLEADDDGHIHGPIDAPEDAAFRARVLILLLSVHSLIEGLAVGIEAEIAALVAILIAILAHKGPEAYALGVSLYEAETPRPSMIRQSLLYAAMTPIGIAIGAAVSTSLSGDGEAMTEAIFDGLAAGSFIYIATIGILKREFSDPSRLLWKFGAAVAGVVLVSVVAIWA